MNNMKEEDIDIIKTKYTLGGVDVGQYFLDFDDGSENFPEPDELAAQYYNGSDDDDDDYDDDDDDDDNDDNTMMMNSEYEYKNSY